MGAQHAATAAGPGRWRLPSLATLRSALRLAALTTVAGLLFWAVAPTAMGWRAALIISGSMTPSIRPGDLVILAPIDAATVARTPLVGAVVQVHNPVRPGELLVHRVIAKEPTGALVTKGDANATRDHVPVPPSQVLGVGRLRVPYVGLPVLWFRNNQKVPLVACGCVLLALVWPERSRPGSAPATLAASA